VNKRSRSATAVVASGGSAHGNSNGEILLKDSVVITVQWDTTACP
jgi:hypothetical protein